MDHLLLLVVFVLAYVLGSIPTAVWVGQWFFKKDIRNEGSGNAGATNTFRVLGPGAAIPVMIIDILKGVAAILLVSYILPDNIYTESQMITFEIIAGFCAVIGHALPLFAGFRGGKGVATLFGVGIVLFPVAVWVAVAVFALVLALTAYVSLGSILGALAFMVSAIWIFPATHPGLIGLAVLAAVFVCWTHRTNIKRLINGNENRLWKKKASNN